MSSPSLQRVADRYLSGEISAPIALMEMLLEASDADLIASSLPALRGDPAKLEALSGLAREHAAGCATIEAMLKRGLDSPEPAASVDEGIARARRLFDDSVTQNEEASVALYSLGSAELLARATDEVVAVLTQWRVLREDRDALEIGCGIGRLLHPLSSMLRTVVGIDVSPGMVAAALRRLHGVSNVEVQLTSGRDLATFADGSFDLVYSVDAFPYLVLAGSELVAAHLREIYRVLRPGGDLVIFSYAYNRSREADADELRTLGAQAGLQIVRSDETPFALWNAAAYQLRR